MSRVQQLLDTCWDRVTQLDYIFVTQVMSFINEIEKILGIPTFFTLAEISILEKTIAKDASLKVYKGRVGDYLLTLAKFSSFEKLFRDRFGMSVYDLPLSVKENTHKRTPMRSSILSSRPYVVPSASLLSPPFSPKLESTYNSYGGLGVDQQVRELQRENTILQSTSKVQLTRISNLEKELKSLKDNTSYVDSKQLLRELSEKDNEISKLKSYQIEVDELIDSINQQDELMKKLQENLDLQTTGKDSKTFQQFVNNLPYIKQYYLMFKYKQNNKDWKVVIVNIVALILTALILVNSFKFSLYLFKSSSTPYLYLYPDESSAVSITWWKEIEWLEYLVYAFND